MPATYKSPGVYVEEVPPMSRPIAGVSTSTPGFVGIVATDAGNAIDLPALKNKWVKQKIGSEKGKPYRVTSWANYVRLFGDFVGATLKEDKDYKEEQSSLGNFNKQQQLAHAVFGFFNNGGTSCYVVRIGAIAELDAALKALSAIEEISMVAAPALDSHKTLTDYAVNHQQFAILDLAKDAPVSLDKLTVDTCSYAAAYHPWLRVSDPASKLLKAEGDGTLLVPPSGHVAGVYARSDAARGAFKAPANEALLGVLGLASDVTKDDQSDLNERGINVIRQLNGALRIWGARTAGGVANGEYRYISTRRYFNYLRQSIDRGTQFVVFEPHTPALWQRVIRTLSDFLTNEWRAGGLFGETAKQAFFIKCDAETNPPETREQGQLIAEIGVAIVKPAEFVIFRIQQNSGS